MKKVNNKKGKGIIGITLAAIMITLIFVALNPVPVIASPSGSSLRIYGTFGEGPGDHEVRDPENRLETRESSLLRSDRTVPSTASASTEEGLCVFQPCYHGPQPGLS